MSHRTFKFSTNEDGDSTFLVFLSEAKTVAESASVDGLKWFEALPAKTWHTQAYGEVPVTEDKLNRFVKNFHDNVRGQEIATNYNHGADISKGDKASGWMKDCKVINGSLWLGVDFTEPARTELKNKEWRYFSLEWKDRWMHPETQVVHEDVIVGGALTNTPVAKGMLPINFSEFVDEASFLKDPLHMSEGGDNEVELEELLKKLRATFKLSETTDADTLVAEVVKLSEKNTELETQVKTLNDEIAPLRTIQEKHNQTKTFAEQFPEQAKMLAEQGEVIRKGEAKTFAEGYRSKRFSEVTDEKNDAGELVVKQTTKGLSAIAVENLENTYLKFAEGSVTMEDFTLTINSILDNGFVEFGERGSSTELHESKVLPATNREARRLFGEKVAEVMEKDKIDDVFAATAVAAKAYPELFAMYQNPHITA